VQNTTSIIVTTLTKQPPKTGNNAGSGLDYAHITNLYWLPWLMTGDSVYVRNLEKIHRDFMSWRKRDLGSSFGTKVSGRQLAWNLRDLSQLVIMQREGVTEYDTYEPSFASQCRYMTSRALPDKRKAHDTFRVFTFSFVTFQSYGFVGWKRRWSGT